MPKKKPKPRRLFPRREKMPLIPPEMERLRDARKVIDRNESYSLELPDGSTYTTTGAEMLATADGMLALADAQKAGDLRGIEEALRRLLKT